MRDRESSRVSRVTAAVYGRVGCLLATPPDKKQRKQAGNVAALTAMLAETRQAQRRLLALVTRLQAVEHSIQAALQDAAPLPRRTPRRSATSGPARPRPTPPPA